MSEISEALLKARTDVKDELNKVNTPDELMRWHRCLNYLDTLGAPERSVFVSYHKYGGTIYFNELKRVLKLHELEVVTGFDHTPGELTVAGTVLHRLRASSVYVGILTPDFPIESAPHGVGAPSVWTIEEKGMAMALEKPFVLMVHKKVHDLFVSTSQTLIHHRFDEDDYVHVVKRVLDSVVTLYDKATH